jgi:hypothetical protein
MINVYLRGELALRVLGGVRLINVYLRGELALRVLGGVLFRASF